MKFLKLLGRGTLYHLFSLSLSLNLAPVSAPSCSRVGLRKAFAALNLLIMYIFHVCFEGTLRLH